MSKPEPTEPVPKIYSAMSAVMAGIGAIGKDQKNIQQRFKFRGIDQAYNAIHPLMAKQKIFTVPRVLDMLMREERTTRKGAVLTFTLLSVEYDFVSGVDGSKVTLGPVIGEGMDSGDKGVAKALSIAHKYALMQAFMVPTEETNDPDKEAFDNVNPKATTKKTTPTKKVTTKKVTKKAAAKKAAAQPVEPEPDGDEGALVISTPSEATFLADELCNLADMHKESEQALKDFWRKNSRPINKLKAEFPDPYQRVLNHFAELKSQLQGEDNE